MAVIFVWFYIFNFNFIFYIFLDFSLCVLKNSTNTPLSICLHGTDWLLNFFIYYSTYLGVKKMYSHCFFI